MKRARRVLLPLTTLGAGVLPACAGRPVVTAPPAPAERAAAAGPADVTRADDRATRLTDSLLALMTLDEKLGQLRQAPAEWNQTGPGAPAGGDQLVREGKIGSFLSFWGAAATRRMQRIAVEESRLGIPLLFAQDVIHGWRTVFPVPLAEASSFDPDAVERASRIAAVEATAYGIHWTFAPMVDIARDPRWGRVVEGAGEDPYLGSAIAAARVRGFQGDDLAAPNTMLATAKHFAAYGAAEGGRDYNTAEVSERTLLEVYLPPFEAAVRAGAGSVMSSFNDIGGTPAHGSSWLLGDVLRGRWRFEGLVVSDWAGVEEMMAHGIAATRAEAGRRALEAGVDVEMASTIYGTDLPGLVRSGRLPERVVDESVRRVLRAKHALGLFDDPYRYSDTTRERQVTLSAEHRAAARELAGNSVVLLRNEGGTLPLRAGFGTIAVIGPLADDARSALGSWAGAGREEDAVTVLAGLRRAAGPGTRVTHARGAPVDTADASGIRRALRLARAADAVVLVLGERENMSAEAHSRASLELPGSQLALAQAVIRGTHRATPRKPIVVVLMNGRPLATPWLADSAPALVESWFLGVEHGNALADVLFGRRNPSGRLPVSVPRATGQVPIYYNHKNTGRPPTAENMYTSKYIDVPWTPLYPFGYGLSYTRFRYGAPSVSATRLPSTDSVVVSAEVTNAGDRAGDEVVQLYLRDDAASVARPVRELRGFRRLSLLPGETRRVSFTLRPEDLALYDLTLRRVVEPGSFTAWVGPSSADGGEVRFEVTGDTLVLAPPPPRFR